MYQPKTIPASKLSNDLPFPVFGANGVIGRFSEFNHEKPQIAITCRGATCGNIHITPSRSWITGIAMVIQPFNSIVTFKYLYYALKNTTLTDSITGSAQPQITRSNLEMTTIQIHEDLKTQTKIAGVLSALDDKIELNNRINAQLEQLARTLYDYWFVQFDFPNGEGKPYRASGGKMKFSPELNREIPEEWEAEKLVDLLEFKKGFEPGSKNYLFEKSKDTIDFFRLQELNSGKNIYISRDLKPNIEILKPHNVAVSFDGTIGNIYYGFSGAFSGAVQKIESKVPQINNATIFQIFSDDKMKESILQFASGSVIKHAGKAIPFLQICYNENIFAEFSERINPFFNKIIANKLENQKLTELRDWLLPLLMSGQVQIKD